MTPADYNATQLAAGELTWGDITKMVRLWQRSHGLTEDGMAGPNTLATFGPERWIGCPLPVLEDGRRAVVTSEFRPADRPNHNGVDLFYSHRTGDKPDFVGDKGCAGRRADGRPAWVVPYGTVAIAAAPGKVQIAGNSATGYRVWIDHNNGLRTGYFHLLDVRVTVGQELELGAVLGLVGDNPADHDGRHLHFELSPVDYYEPMDPVPHMVGDVA